MVNITYFILIFVGLLLATIFDLKERRIPNWLTVSMTITGLANSLIHKGLSGLGEHVIAFVFGFSLFLIFYFIGAFGAGDVKLIASLGAIMGLEFILTGSILILLIGGMISLIILMKNDGLGYIGNLIVSFLRSLLTGKITSMKKSIIKKPMNYYPYTIAITMGSMVTIWHIYPIS